MQRVRRLVRPKALDLIRVWKVLKSFIGEWIGLKIDHGEGECALHAHQSQSVRVYSQTPRNVEFTAACSLDLMQQLRLGVFDFGTLRRDP